MCSTEDQQEVFSLHPSSSASSVVRYKGLYWVLRSSREIQGTLISLLMRVTAPSSTGCYRSLQYRLLQVPPVQAVTGPSSTGCYRSLPES
uniref:Uncharacterized protein n=1 Tax=Timema monikensis TaxID=170555 RepID=A0A7R9ECF4_9NEOP|nr:unnamed protein product [Timema monikensis]